MDGSNEPSYPRVTKSFGLFADSSSHSPNDVTLKGTDENSYGGQQPSPPRTVSAPSHISTLLANTQSASASHTDTNTDAPVHAEDTPGQPSWLLKAAMWLGYRPSTPTDAPPSPPSSLPPPSSCATSTLAALTTHVEEVVSSISSSNAAVKARAEDLRALLESLASQASPSGASPSFKKTPTSTTVSSSSSRFPSLASSSSPSAPPPSASCDMRQRVEAAMDALFDELHQALQHQAMPQKQSTASTNGATAGASSTSCGGFFPFDCFRPSTCTGTGTGAVTAGVKSPLELSSVQADVSSVLSSFTSAGQLMASLGQPQGQPQTRAPMPTLPQPQLALPPFLQPLAPPSTGDSGSGGSDGGGLGGSGGSGVRSRSSIFTDWSRRWGLGVFGNQADKLGGGGISGGGSSSVGVGGSTDDKLRSIESFIASLDANASTTSMNTIFDELKKKLSNAAEIGKSPNSGFFNTPDLTKISRLWSVDGLLQMVEDVFARQLLYNMYAPVIGSLLMCSCTGMFFFREWSIQNQHQRLEEYLSSHTQGLLLPGSHSLPLHADDMAPAQRAWAERANGSGGGRGGGGDHGNAAGGVFPLRYHDPAPPTLSSSSSHLSPSSPCSPCSSAHLAGHPSHSDSSLLYSARKAQIESVRGFLTLQFPTHAAYEHYMYDLTHLAFPAPSHPLSLPSHSSSSSSSSSSHTSLPSASPAPNTLSPTPTHPTLPPLQPRRRSRASLSHIHAHTRPLDRHSSTHLPSSPSTSPSSPSTSASLPSTSAVASAANCFLFLDVTVAPVLPPLEAAVDQYLDHARKADALPAAGRTREATTASHGDCTRAADVIPHNASGHEDTIARDDDNRNVHATRHDGHHPCNARGDATVGVAAVGGDVCGGLTGAASESMAAGGCDGEGGSGSGDSRGSGGSGERRDCRDAACVTPTTPASSSPTPSRDTSPPPHSPSPPLSRPPSSLSSRLSLLPPIHAPSPPPSQELSLSSLLQHTLTASTEVEVLVWSQSVIARVQARPPRADGGEYTPHTPQRYTHVHYDQIWVSENKIPDSGKFLIPGYVNIPTSLQRAYCRLPDPQVRASVPHIHAADAQQAFASTSSSFAAAFPSSSPSSPPISSSPSSPSPSSVSASAAPCVASGVFLSHALINAKRVHTQLPYVHAPVTRVRARLMRRRTRRGVHVGRQRGVGVGRADGDRGDRVGVAREGREGRWVAHAVAKKGADEVEVDVKQDAYVGEPLERQVLVVEEEEEDGEEDEEGDMWEDEAVVWEEQEEVWLPVDADGWVYFTAEQAEALARTQHLYAAQRPRGPCVAPNLRHARGASPTDVDSPTLAASSLPPASPACSPSLSPSAASPLSRPLHTPSPASTSPPVLSAPPSLPVGSVRLRWRLCPARTYTAKGILDTVYPMPKAQTHKARPHARKASFRGSPSASMRESPVLSPHALFCAQDARAHGVGHSPSLASASPHPPSASPSASYTPADGVLPLATAAQPHSPHASTATLTSAAASSAASAAASSAIPSGAPHTFLIPSASPLLPPPVTLLCPLPPSTSLRILPLSSSYLSHLSSVATSFITADTRAASLTSHLATALSIVVGTYLMWLPLKTATSGIPALNQAIHEASWVSVLLISAIDYASLCGITQILRKLRCTNKYVYIGSYAVWIGSNVYAAMCLIHALIHGARDEFQDSVTELVDRMKLVNLRESIGAALKDLFD